MLSWGMQYTITICITIPHTKTIKTTRWWKKKEAWCFNKAEILSFYHLYISAILCVSDRYCRDIVWMWLCLVGVCACLQIEFLVMLWNEWISIFIVKFISWNEWHINFPFQLQGLGRLVGYTIEHNTWYEREYNNEFVVIKLRENREMKNEKIAIITWK